MGHSCRRSARDSLQGTRRITGSTGSAEDGEANAAALRAAIAASRGATIFARLVLEAMRDVGLLAPAQQASLRTADSGWEVVVGRSCSYVRQGCDPAHQSCARAVERAEDVVVPEALQAEEELEEAAGRRREGGGGGGLQGALQCEGQIADTQLQPERHVHITAAHRPRFARQQIRLTCTRQRAVSARASVAVRRARMRRQSCMMV